MIGQEIGQYQLALQQFKNCIKCLETHVRVNCFYSLHLIKFVAWYQFLRQCDLLIPLNVIWGAWGAVWRILLIIFLKDQPYHCIMPPYNVTCTLSKFIKIFCVYISFFLSFFKSETNSLRALVGYGISYIFLPIPRF